MANKRTPDVEHANFEGQSVQVKIRCAITVWAVPFHDGGGRLFLTPCWELQSLLMESVPSSYRRAENVT